MTNNVLIRNALPTAYSFRDYVATSTIPPDQLWHFSIPQGMHRAVFPNRTKPRTRRPQVAQGKAALRSPPWVQRPLASCLFSSSGLALLSANPDGEKGIIIVGSQPRTAAFGLGYSRSPFQGLALCTSGCNLKFAVLSSTHCFVSIPEIVNPEPDDLELSLFSQRCGRAHHLFGAKLLPLLDELSQTLAA